MINKGKKLRRRTGTKFCVFPLLSLTRLYTTYTYCHSLSVIETTDSIRFIPLRFFFAFLFCFGCSFVRLLVGSWCSLCECVCVYLVGWYHLDVGLFCTTDATIHESTLLLSLWPLYEIRCFTRTVYDVYSRNCVSVYFAQYCRLHSTIFLLPLVLPVFSSSVHSIIFLCICCCHCWKIWKSKNKNFFFLSMNMILKLTS